MAYLCFGLFLALVVACYWLYRYHQVIRSYEAIEAYKRFVIQRFAYTKQSEKDIEILLDNIENK